MAFLKGKSTQPYSVLFGSLKKGVDGGELVFGVMGNPRASPLNETMVRVDYPFFCFVCVCVCVGGGGGGGGGVG